MGVEACGIGVFAVGLPNDIEAELLPPVVFEQLAMTFDRSKLMTGVVGRGVTVAVVVGVDDVVVGAGSTVCTGCTNGCCSLLIVGGSIFCGVDVQRLLPLLPIVRGATVVAGSLVMTEG